VIFSIAGCRVVIEIRPWPLIVEMRGRLNKAPGRCCPDFGRADRKCDPATGKRRSRRIGMLCRFPHLVPDPLLEQ
jgi:hypothetical protein